MAKKAFEYWIEGEVPEVCPTCGQTIDRRDLRVIEYHKTPRHLPYAGKKRGWR